MFGMLEKAKITIQRQRRGSDEVPCAFNPAQYSIRNSVNYAEQKNLGGKDTPANFLNDNGRELSVTLYFDTMGPPSMLTKANTKLSVAVVPVSYWTDKLLKASEPSSKSEPPLVTFNWGNLKFSGKLTSVNATFTMFTPDGKPVRAKVDLTIKETQTNNSALSGLEDVVEGLTKCRTVVQGMSLWSIAFEEYGTCAKWRDIAKANKLMNPLDLIPGQKLKLP